MTRTGSIFLALVGAIALATGTYAQTPQQDPAHGDLPFVWSQRPTGHDFERYYPHHAIEAGRSGVGVLCCTANADGTISCDAVYENPPGEGFGAAAVNIAHSFHMNAQDAVTWSTSREKFRVPIWFLMNRKSSDPDVQAFIAQTSLATENICRAAAN